MVDIKEVLKKLAAKRPVFHLEIDFQHALAWEIHEQEPKCQMRLDFRVQWLHEPSYVDIWCKHKDTILAIELKYKTRKLHVEADGEAFDLKEQGARDIARYYFLKDIQRLERIAIDHDKITGYALMLTNDPEYWNLPRFRETNDAEFRIHQGATRTGELHWKPGTSSKTTEGREELSLKGKYFFNWGFYSKQFEKPYGEFRYALVRVI